MIFKVLLAPNLELAYKVVEQFLPEATVEAEYGDACVEGVMQTLAHHGPRSANPAPCSQDVPTLPDNNIVLVSHIDLDTVGGILALEGIKPDDPEFWDGAAFIDVNGPHHLHELPPRVQEQLNAVWAWASTQPRVRYTDVTDVTSDVLAYAQELEKILVEKDMGEIENGKEWAEARTAEVESKLICETDHLRVFITDRTFCAASYYSPVDQQIKDATITLNDAGAITIAFADGGERFSAKDLVQALWGPDAGGRDAIAGSPRGRVMTQEEFEAAVEILSYQLEHPSCDVPAFLNRISGASTAKEIEGILTDAPLSLTVLPSVALIGSKAILQLEQQGHGGKASDKNEIEV